MNVTSIRNMIGQKLPKRPWWEKVPVNVTSIRTLIGRKLPKYPWTLSSR